MHELSITQGIIEICVQNAGGRRVKEVTLEIGALSGVIPEAVEFCFEACANGTLLEGARLAIDRVPGCGRCTGCHAEFPIQTLYDTCPSCGKAGVGIVTGDELRVKEIEVED